MSVQEGSSHFVVPDSIEPVVGWKAWKPLNDFLVSPTVGGIWKQEEAMVARCQGLRLGNLTRDGRRDRDHDSPGDRCPCGIHLAQTPLAALSYGPIIGRVYGWGKTIVHNEGWRVQYAYPMEIYSVFTKDQWLDLYGVPVHRITAEDLGRLVDAKLNWTGASVLDLRTHASLRRMFGQR